MSVLHIGKAEFDEKIRNSEKPVLVDFYATWCGPCKMIAPILEEIAEEHPEYVIAKVNVDEEPELAKQFGIYSIPTLIVFKNGQVDSQASGVRPKASILGML
jgi:thioredoxin 1